MTDLSPRFEALKELLLVELQRGDEVALVHLRNIDRQIQNIRDGQEELKRLLLANGELLRARVNGGEA